MKKLFVLLTVVFLTACSAMNNCSPSETDPTMTCRMSESADRAVESAASDVVYSFASSVADVISSTVSGVLH